MARKKSRSSFIMWALVSIVSGSGISGFIKPDLPVIGPLVKRLVSDKSAQLGIDEERINQVRGLRDKIGGGSHEDLGSVQVPAQLVSAQRPSNGLLIASFNIQVLGQSKMSKPGVVEVLAHVIRQFDIVAIQEVRSKEDDVIPRLVESVNAGGGRYNHLIGPRLGRTVSTEQYAYIFDTNRVEHEPSAVGTIQDPNDLMHREPFVARFRTRTQTPDRSFSFWLVNAHTDPDEVPQEIAALADIFEVMQSARPDEDDVILLGDLNASEDQLGRLGQIPGIHWAVRGVMTNTRQNKMYDNIIFHGPSTSEFTGRWGVFDLEGTFGITRDQALKVSDHLPVWAEFQPWEAVPQDRFADRPFGLRRN